ncbi:MAG TPA: hypothetical protein V6D08_00550 [Candidatus Obscuribacterales bacterium]
MTSLADILHNITDHTDTILRVLGQQDLSQDFMSRMMDHILFEEKENTARLQELQNSEPSPLIQKLIDHSFFIQKIIKDESMPVDLKQELLGHFLEEHQVWQSDLPAPEIKTAPETRGWTVGPMWQQGG